MYLLIQNENFVLMSIQQYLHPTMYLLIQRSAYIQPARLRLFTSHYVSINSVNTSPFNSVMHVHLHPTMYLLILGIPPSLIFFAEYLHPTMYLLIRVSHGALLKIKRYLHPTMYLLIPVLFYEHIH